MPFCWRWLARFLNLGALAATIYLLAISGWSAGSVDGCGNEGGLACDAVLGSGWSRWLGFPVTVPGAVVYLASFLALLVIGPRWPVRVRRVAWKALLCLAVMQAGAACWFLALQAFVLRSFCPYCLTAHACGLMAAALVLWYSPVSWRPAERMSEGIGLSPRTAGLLLAVGLVGPGLLIAGQLRPGARTQTISIERKDPKNIGPIQAASVSSPAPGTHAGKTQPKRILEVFDYTCLHCRRLHGEMKKAQQRYGPQLAVVLFPMGMCTDCNPFVQKTEPGHELACEYARLALAVKILDGAAFDKLHEWLMAPAEVPPLPEARAYAGTLVDRAALERILAGPQANVELKKIVDYYGRTGQGKLPKLIAGETILTGAANEQQLAEFLEKHAGVKAP